MGFFSWKTQDTNKSICNSYSGKKPFTVYMKDDKGKVWKESSYDGYGIFGGKDFYELLAEMNGKTTRDEGITLFFGDKHFRSPNLVEDITWEWMDIPPDKCEDQGYFYDDIMDEIFE